MSILEKKTFTIVFQTDGKRGEMQISLPYPRPFNFIELLKKAAHAEVENPDIFKDLVECPAFSIPEIKTPVLKVSYRLAEKIGILNVFEKSFSVRMAIPNADLLKMLTFELRKKHICWNSQHEIYLCAILDEDKLINYIATNCGNVKEEGDDYFSIQSNPANQPRAGFFLT